MQEKHINNPEEARGEGYEFPVGAEGESKTNYFHRRGVYIFWYFFGNGPE